MPLATPARATAAVWAFSYLMAFSSLAALLALSQQTTHGEQSGGFAESHSFSRK